VYASFTSILLPLELHYHPIPPHLITHQHPATAPSTIPAISPSGHVMEGIANCHHTQTESQDFTFAAVSACHTASMSAEIQIYYLWLTLELGHTVNYIA